MVVEPGGRGGAPRLSLRSGLLAPRLLGCSPGVARLALVATTAILLGGDAVRLRIHVGSGQRLELEDVAATVAYDGRGLSARWSVSISIEPEASLLWRAEPFVVSGGASVVRHLDVDVARSGRLLMRDVLVLGRHGERGGDLRCRTDVSYDCAPLLIEELQLTGPPGGQREEPGILGPHRVAESITFIAERDSTVAMGAPLPAMAAPPLGLPDPDVAVLLPLPGPGVLVRRLGASTHASPLDATWAQLSRQLRGE